MNRQIASLPTTIFTVMSALATEHGAVNLGQGFPDAEGPEAVRAKAADAVHHGWNQYPPMRGLLDLRKAIAAHYARFQRIDGLDPDQEIVVTSGATEALAAAFFGLVEPGDEVIMFQPLYDSYLPIVVRGGGVPKLVRLTPPDWKITKEMLEAAWSPKTKLLVLNNPLNPTAKVFTREELSVIAEFCVRRDVVAICDEVWEHVVFDGRRHVPLMGLPGMRERTVKIGSAGKIFSLTGWKVGWLMAAPPLADAVAKAHMFLTFTTPPNLQAAVAYGLGMPDDYFAGLRAELQESRDYLKAGFEKQGFKVLPSEGSYFFCVDLPASGIETDDMIFCTRLVKEVGVAAIPVSAFYAEDPVTSVVRFCFSKKRATLDAALERLPKARRLDWSKPVPVRA
jgi:aspartate/methionine/tyrosine aminotransferase